MKYALYPGCTLHGTAREYGESTVAVFDRLSLELIEIPDWSCCGATAVAATGRLASYVVPLRNLAIAEEIGLDVAVACSACFMILSRARNAYLAGGELQQQMKEALAAVGRKFEGKVRVRHTLDIIAHDVGARDIERQVTVDLSRLVMAPYYGCQIARPDNKVFDPEQPIQLDDLMRALGVTVTAFDRKTKCCGAALMTTKPDAALGLNEDLLREAAGREVDAVVTTCPMCQMNLEAYQGKINKKFRTKYNIPVLYFTQVLGLALGIPARDLGLHRHMVSTRNITKKLVQEVVS